MQSSFDRPKWTPWAAVFHSMVLSQNKQFSRYQRESLATHTSYWSSYFCMVDAIPESSKQRKWAKGGKLYFVDTYTILTPVHVPPVSYALILYAPLKLKVEPVIYLCSVIDHFTWRETGHIPPGICSEVNGGMRIIRTRDWLVYHSVSGQLWHGELSSGYVPLGRARNTI